MREREPILDEAAFGVVAFGQLLAAGIAVSVRMEKAREVRVVEKIVEIPKIVTVPARQPEAAVQFDTAIVTCVPATPVPQALTLTETGIVVPSVVFDGGTVNASVWLVPIVVVELTGNCVSGTPNTCWNESPENDDPVHARPFHVAGEQVGVELIATGNVRSNFCNGLSGDMLEIDTLVVVYVICPIHVDVGAARSV